MTITPALPGNPVTSVDSADRNNNFYDNTPSFPLPGGSIMIEGEIENPGTIDFKNLVKRTVIVKETLLNSDGTNSFIGAYRYDGYSLFDILCERIIKKKNAEEFRPIIDLYIEIENAKGEKVVLTWGEIYYPNNLHNILIATDVARIVPSKTKDLWPLPNERKLVVVTDLITERNISDPVKITVKSWAKNIPVNRDISPLYSDNFIIRSGDKTLEKISDLPKKTQLETIHTIFYGKGRGIHSTQPFTGMYLKDLLAKHIPFESHNLKTGLLIGIGFDGYRAVYSFSEVMNRNDQSEVMLVPCKEEKDGGSYRLLPAGDFFSDRAVKALSAIDFENIIPAR